MAELEEIFARRKEAKNEKNLFELAKCSREMLEIFSFDDVRREAAYFFGRLKDYSGFANMLQNARERALNIDERCRTYDVERRFFNIGLAYPNLEEEDLDFLEEKYMCSGDYEMIDRMLFDKERLPRVLRHFDAETFDIKNEDFSDELLDKVFRAAWKNEFELNIQEAIDNRYNAQTQNETWGRMFDCQYDPSEEPIFVYNRRTNQVQLDRSSLDNVMLFPIHKLGNIENVVEKYGSYFGEEVKNYIIETIIPEIGLEHGWKWAVFCCYWYRSINIGVIKHFNIPKGDVRLNQIRRDIAREWLVEVNNKSLR